MLWYEAKDDSAITHIEYDVENRLEYDDVAVTRPFRQLLLLLNLLVLVVDKLIVLLRHPLCVICMYVQERQTDQNRVREGESVQIRNMWVDPTKLPS